MRERLGNRRGNFFPARRCNFCRTGRGAESRNVDAAFLNNAANLG